MGLKGCSLTNICLVSQSVVLGLMSGFFLKWDIRIEVSITPLKKNANGEGLILRLTKMLIYFCKMTTNQANPNGAQYVDRLGFD